MMVEKSLQFHFLAVLSLSRYTVQSLPLVFSQAPGPLTWETKGLIRPGVLFQRYYVMNAGC